MAFVIALQDSPVIVKIIETPTDPTGLADKLLGALGLTGAILLLAVICGGLVAGAMTWWRRRSRD
jgi:hypothetical protein